MSTPDITTARLQAAGLPRATTSIMRCKGGDAMAAVFADREGRPCAALWTGPRTLKPTWRYRFPSPEARAKRIADAFALARDWQARRAASTAPGRLLEVGDILRASWGYEQTNIDYYQVTALVGATQVEARKIAAQSLETQSMQGKCVPSPGEFIGEAKRYKATGDRIKVASYAHATRITPQVLPGGVKVYPADHWTAYA